MVLEKPAEQKRNLIKSYIKIVEHQNNFLELGEEAMKPFSSS